MGRARPQTAIQRLIYDRHYKRGKSGVSGSKEINRTVNLENPEDPPKDPLNRSLLTYSLFPRYIENKKVVAEFKPRADSIATESILNDSHTTVQFDLGEIHSVQTSQF